MHFGLSSYFQNSSHSPIRNNRVLKIVLHKETMNFCFYLPRLNIAMPRPPLDNISIDWLTISGMRNPHLHKLTLFVTFIIVYDQEFKMACWQTCFNYLKCMLDQIKPIKVAYVLGFFISFFPTLARMGKTFSFLFVLGSTSSSPFDCTSRSVSVSPYRHLWNIENYTIFISGNISAL